MEYAEYFVVGAAEAHVIGLLEVKVPFLEDVEKINEGDSLEIDLSSGIIKNLTQGKTYKTQAFPEFLQEIVENGGLMNWVKAKREAK